MSSSMARELGGSGMAYKTNRRVAPSSVLSAWDRVLVGIYFVGLFLCALLYIWVQSQVVEASYRLSSLRHEDSALRSKNDDLRVEIATRRAPAALSRVATEQLRMVSPEPGQVVVIEATR